MQNTSVSLAVIPPDLAQMRPADHRVTFDDSVDSEENDDRNEILMGPDTSRLQSAQTVNTPISEETMETGIEDVENDDEPSYLPNYYH